MIKRFLPTMPVLAAFLFVGSLLAGCGGAPTPIAESSPTAVAEVITPTEAAKIAPTQASEATATIAPAQAEVTPADATSAEGCTAVEFPTNPKIPAVSEKDWVLGSKDAAITMIEYGDFQ